MIGKTRNVLLAAALSVIVYTGLARATVYTLDTWNTTELQTSLDTVTVIAGGGSLNGFTCQDDQLCLHWNDGAGTATPTVKAIITFAYDDGSGATTARRRIPQQVGLPRGISTDRAMRMALACSNETTIKVAAMKTRPERPIGWCLPLPVSHRV